MVSARRLLLVTVLLGVLAGGLPADDGRPVRMTWLDDLQRAIKLAHGKDLPILLFVRDVFGEEFIDYAERRFSWGEQSLRFQLNRSGARWRWQHYEQDLFTRPDVVAAAQPYVKARLTIGRKMEEKARDLLLQLRLLNDTDLAWRQRLREDPWDRYVVAYDVIGLPLYGRRLNTTLDELLARETTYLVVLAGDGQPLLVFPVEPPPVELVAQLRRVLEPYKALATARNELLEGRAGTAAEILTRLSAPRPPEVPFPKEVQQAAARNLETLVAAAREQARKIESALAAGDLVGTWRLARGLEGQGLSQADPAIGKAVDQARQGVTAHTRKLWERARQLLQEEKLVEVVEVLNTLTEDFPGTEAGSLAEKKAAELSRDPEFAERFRQAHRRSRARELLAQAAAAVQADDLVAAYGLYRTLAQQFPDLPEGTEAAAELVEWEADQELMTRVRGLQAEKEARQWMTLADNFLANDHYSEAMQYYQKVVEKYPDTEVAAQAEAKLEEARLLLEAELRVADPSAAEGEAGEPEPEGAEGD